MEQNAFHTGAVIGFKTRKGEVVHARVASSFISPEQAEANLCELGADDFDTLVRKGKDAWNRVLGKIEVEGGTDAVSYTHLTLQTNNIAPSIPVSTVRCFFRVSFMKWMRKDSRYITVLIMARCCPVIYIPIPAFGIHSAACFHCST